MGQINNTTKIFIQNATVIDCAVLLPQQGPCGKSWFVDITWEGTLDADGILFDFGEAKKNAKLIIDREFDHKLLVLQENIRQENETHMLVCGALARTAEAADALSFCLNTYKDGIRVISATAMDSISANSLAALEQEIAREILRKSPDNISNIAIKLHLDENPLELQKNSFYYMHSLCYHRGNCQRYHGHKSSVKIFNNDTLDIALSSQIAQKFNNKYIIKYSYIDEKKEQKLTREILEHCPEIAKNISAYECISYMGSQGAVAVALPKTNLIIMEQESTIENIACLIRSSLPAMSAYNVHAFEGLCKGAISS